MTGNLARKSYQDGGYWSIDNVAFGNCKITPCFTALTDYVPTHAFKRGADGNPVLTCVATGEVVPLIPVNIRDKSGEAKLRIKTKDQVNMTPAQRAEMGEKGKRYAEENIERPILCERFIEDMW